MKLFSILVLAFFVSFVSAGGIELPDEGLNYYDLVAMVAISSRDENALIPYYRADKYEYFGNPIHLNLIEVLRKSDQVNVDNILVPAKILVAGRPYEGTQLTTDTTIESNSVPIACKTYQLGQTWCVVEWFLTADQWEKYRRQHETGVSAGIESQEDREWREFEEAVRKRMELRYRMKMGELSRGDYERLSAPYTAIIERPIQGSFD